MNSLRETMYKKCYTHDDIRIVDKLVNTLESGDVTRENYWQIICKLTRNTHSDKLLGRWKCLAECAESHLFN